MADPSLDIQGAIITALRADAGVQALVAQRVYDKVPSTTTPFPYVTYGSDQALSDDFDCIEGFEVFITLDVWSRAVGQPEAKRIAGAVRGVLHNADLELNEHALVLLEHRNTRYLKDPDGVTSHAAVEFRALVEGPP